MLCGTHAKLDNVTDLEPCVHDMNVFLFRGTHVDSYLKKLTIYFTLKCVDSLWKLFGI